MINTTIDHSRGIEVNPVNLNMQKQNVVERYVQTHNNMFAALMADNDLLPASFWGLGRGVGGHLYYESCDKFIMC